MKDPEAQEIIKAMIKDADVVVESFKPGQMKKFGLDYEAVKQINPRGHLLLRFRLWADRRKCLASRLLTLSLRA